MKHTLITTILIIAGTISKAQFNCEMGVGYNTHNYPMYEFKFGYDINRIDINGGFSRSLNRDASTHIYPGVEFGYNFLNSINSYWNDYQFTASVGIFHDVINSDQKKLFEQLAAYYFITVQKDNQR